MATFKCNDPIYTILRNGKVITMSARPATAVEAIIDDASRNVCPPDCCITGFNIDIDSFDVLITSPNSDGMYVRVTVTSGGDEYSTAWALSTGSDTIDITGLIVEFGDWEDGNTICVEYSYDQDTVIEGCCTTVVIPNAPFNENATYQLSEVVTECDGGVFDLAFQNPDGGVTVDPDGEMVIPDIAEDETVFVTYSCDDCVSELLILTAKNVVPLQGLRLTFDDILNVPVADPNNVSDWNTFFDLPANGTAFTGVSVTGNEVTLAGGSAITLKANLFIGNEHLTKIEDDTNCVVQLNTNSLLVGGVLGILDTITLNGVIVAQDSVIGSALLTSLTMNNCTTLGQFCINGSPLLTSISLPAALTIADYGLQNNATLASVSLPLATTLGDGVFSNCFDLVSIGLNSCTALGTTTGNDTVFIDIIGNTITITVPTALSTCDGGNPDGDLVYLAANNTATINYI